MSTASSDAKASAPPEPDLTPDELVARAVAMRPELIERQADAEARTYYSEEMHQKFLDAEPLVSRRFALAQVNEALAAALSRELITAVIVPDHGSPRMIV